MEQTIHFSWDPGTVRTPVRFLTLFMSRYRDFLSIFVLITNVTRIESAGKANIVGCHPERNRGESFPWRIWMRYKFLWICCKVSYLKVLPVTSVTSEGEKTSLGKSKEDNKPVTSEDEKAPLGFIHPVHQTFRGFSHQWGRRGSINSIHQGQQTSHGSSHLWAQDIS